VRSSRKLSQREGVVGRIFGTVGRQLQRVGTMTMCDTAIGLRLLGDKIAGEGK